MIRRTHNLAAGPPAVRQIAPDRQPNLEWLSVAVLQTNPRNARTHSKRQLAKLATSLTTFGFTNPIVIDENNMILAGHGRAQVARDEGWPKVPTVRLDRLTDAQKRAFVIADNKIAEEAGWDRELLALELGELIDLLPIDDLDISLTGFEAAEIDLMIADMADAKGAPEDVLPDPAVGDPVTQHGDLWLLGKHRLLCGDARDRQQLERLMKGVKADAVFCDPPFNLRIGSLVGRGRVKHAEFACASGEMSDAEFQRFLETTLGHAAAVSKEGAVHFVVMDWRHVADLIEVGRSLYGEMLNLVVWNKSNAGQGSFYRSQHELIAVFRIGLVGHQNNVRLGAFGRNRSNVWTYAGCNSFGAGRMEALSSHPTVKPVALVADALLDCTTRGAAVLDHFMGSGTTLIAAQKVGRRSFGMEFEPGYVDLAVRRWETITKLEAVLEGDGRTFEDIDSARRTEPLAGPRDPRPGQDHPVFPAADICSSQETDDA